MTVATVEIKTTSRDCVRYRLLVDGKRVWSNRVNPDARGHEGARSRMAAWALERGYQVNDPSIAKPPTNRVLTPDPAAAERKKHWLTLDAAVREAKVLGIKVKDAEIMQAEGKAANEDIDAMRQALEEAIVLRKSQDEEDDKGDFHEAVEGETWRHNE